jgi:hypothetical protein
MTCLLPHRLLFIVITVLAEIIVIVCNAPKAFAQEDDAAIRVHRDKGINSELSSSHYFLSADDISAFKEGKSKSDILKQINWLGNPLMAGRCDEGDAWIISYDLFSSGPNSEGGEVVYAVFVNGKFVKFIKWFAAERIVVPYGESKRTAPKPIKIGDVNWLARAVGSKAVAISALEREFRARPSIPRQVDPGLTIAYLLLRATGNAPGPDSNLSEYTINAKLRDQFNAARLDIGISEFDVEALLNAKPIETFQAKAGKVKVYGSDIAAHVNMLVAYSNVLILFKEGKADAIYTIDGGPDWRESVRERFIDFPR